MCEVMKGEMKTDHNITPFLCKDILEFGDFELGIGIFLVALTKG
jgi:hypothetical protein